MGLIKDNKAATAGAHAARSAQEGHTVLLYRFDVPWSSGRSSGPVSGAAEVIEEIEMEGWHLDQFAYDRAQSMHGAVLLVFRRPPQRGGAVEKPAFGRPAGQWAAGALGVHQVIGGGPMPPYVRRPHDELLAGGRPRPAPDSRTPAAPGVPAAANPASSTSTATLVPFHRKKESFTR